MSSITGTTLAVAGLLLMAGCATNPTAPTRALDPTSGFLTMRESPREIVPRRRLEATPHDLRAVGRPQPSELVLKSRPARRF
jgi:hypothetical protein